MPSVRPSRRKPTLREIAPHTEPTPCVQREKSNLLPIHRTVDRVPLDLRGASRGELQALERELMDDLDGNDKNEGDACESRAGGGLEALEEKLRRSLDGNGTPGKLQALEMELMACLDGMDEGGGNDGNLRVEGGLDALEEQPRRRLDGNGTSGMSRALEKELMGSLDGSNESNLRVEGGLDASEEQTSLQVDDLEHDEEELEKRFNAEFDYGEQGEDVNVEIEDDKVEYAERGGDCFSPGEHRVKKDDGEQRDEVDELISIELKAKQHDPKEQVSKRKQEQLESDLESRREEQQQQQQQREEGLSQELEDAKLTNLMLTRQKVELQIRVEELSERRGHDLDVGELANQMKELAKELSKVKEENLDLKSRLEVAQIVKSSAINNARLISGSSTIANVVAPVMVTIPATLSDTSSGGFGKIIRDYEARIRYLEDEVSNERLKRTNESAKRMEKESECVRLRRQADDTKAEMVSLQLKLARLEMSSGNSASEGFVNTIPSDFDERGAAAPGGVGGPRKSFFRPNNPVAKPSTAMGISSLPVLKENDPRNRQRQEEETCNQQ